MATYTLDTHHTHVPRTITARSHRQALAQLSRLLTVDGPRALLAETASGAAVYASLYDGEDWIMAADGRALLGDPYNVQ